jgi:hypothetical protein
MAMLGDLLAAARGSAGSLRPWLETGDPELAGRLDAAAAAAGLSAAAYARMAVADFSRLASEEDWATLMSSLRDSDDPGAQCLQAMVHWRLNVTACGAHSGGKDPRNQEGTGDERSLERQS